MTFKIGEDLVSEPFSALTSAALGARGLVEEKVLVVRLEKGLDRDDAEFIAAGGCVWKPAPVAGMEERRVDDDVNGNAGDVEDEDVVEEKGVEEKGEVEEDDEENEKGAEEVVPDGLAKEGGASRVDPKGEAVGCVDGLLKVG